VPNMSSRAKLAGRAFEGAVGMTRVVAPLFGGEFSGCAANVKSGVRPALRRRTHAEQHAPPDDRMG
jgi:hypothetical protein